MADWTRGYRIDQGYSFGAYRELFPDWLDMALVMSGQVAPSELTERPRYLELGCGQGLSLCLAAACNPEIDFVGVDFGAAHIVHGRKLARAASLENVTFLEADVLELAADGREALGEFDYVTMHGLYTWVSAPIREAIVKLLGAIVSPGGLVFASYNSLPGWAPSLPFQHIAQSIARVFPQPGANVIDATVALFEQLRDADADMFAGMPVLSARLAQVKQSEHDYLVQEYLHDGWEALWASRVARELGAAKLDYAGSATLMENLLPQILPEKQRAIVMSMPDPLIQRDLIDCAIMQPFRRDIFVRGRTERLPGEAGADDLLATLIRDVSGETLSLHTIFAQFDVPAAVFRPMLDALAAGPQTMGQLEALPALAGQPPSARSQAVLLLAATGHISLTRAKPRQTEPAKRLNRVLAAEAAKGARYRYLAAPEAGLPVSVPEHQLAAINTIIVDPGADRHKVKAAMVERMARLGRGIERDGKSLQGADADQAAAQIVDRLIETDLPRWRVLGMLD